MAPLSTAFPASSSQLKTRAVLVEFSVDSGEFDHAAFGADFPKNSEPARGLIGFAKAMDHFLSGVSLACAASSQRVAMMVMAETIRHVAFEQTLRDQPNASGYRRPAIKRPRVSVG